MLPHFVFALLHFIYNLQCQVATLAWVLFVDLNWKNFDSVKAVIAFSNHKLIAS